MPEANDFHVAELHSQAAYAHTAAACLHSSGDHATAQELAQKAMKTSAEAVRLSEEIAKRSLQCT